MIPINSTIGDGLAIDKMSETDKVNKVNKADKTDKMDTTNGEELITNISYIVGDASTMGYIGKYDVIIAAYLLCYAPNIPTLDRMVKNMRTNLKKGGEVFVLNLNPDLSELNFEKYGFRIELLSEGFCNGCTMKWNWDTGSSIIHRYSKTTIDVTFGNNGFEKLEWFKMEMPKEYDSLDKNFLEDYVKYCPVIGFRCKLKA